MWAFIQCLMAGRQEGRKDGTCRAESQKKDSSGGGEKWEVTTQHAGRCKTLPPLPDEVAQFVEWSA